MRFLLFSIIVCLTAFASADVFVDEDFEEGVLPTGWQIWEFGDETAVEWEVILEGTGSFPAPDTAHTGDYYVYHDDGTASSPASDSWLVTDTYDFSYSASVNVEFWREIGYWGFYTYTGFWYSTVTSPGPGDFTELFELGNENGYEWWQFTNDVTTECSGEATVTFAWVYVGAYAHSDAIDDLLITGEVSLERDTWGSIKSVF